jgi:hypothetical protein
MAGHEIIINILGFLTFLSKLSIVLEDTMFVYMQIINHVPGRKRSIDVLYNVLRYNRVK